MTLSAVTGLCRLTPSVLPLTANIPPPVTSQTFDIPASMMLQTVTNLPSTGDATSSSSVEEQ